MQLKGFAIYKLKLSEKAYEKNAQLSIKYTALQTSASPTEVVTSPCINKSEKNERCLFFGKWILNLFDAGLLLPEHLLVL